MGVVTEVGCDSQDDKATKRKREFAFVLPDPVAAQEIQATITENGKVRVSVPISTTML